MNIGALSPAFILLTVISLALAPFVAVMVTSFTKIVVVLSLLRNALGTQNVPPNVVVNGLALIMSIYVMYPVILDSYDAMNQRAAQISPKDQKDKVDAGRLIDLASNSKEPLRGFLMKHASDTERAFFLQTARQLLPKESNQLEPNDFIVVVPAFTVTELTAAFQIGFLIFLPFLIIDMIVSNVLLSLGMQMLSPTTVSLPFKLMLFVFVGGWAKLVHGLVLTYR